MKDACDQAGVQFEAIRMDPDYITLRKGPERDREIAKILGNIEKASRIGVSVITYHWTVIPIRRNGDVEVVPLTEVIKETRRVPKELYDLSKVFE